MIINSDEEILVPAHLHFGKYILNSIRQVNPSKVCLHNYSTGEQMTYMELSQYVVNLSAGLTELGVKRGGIVGVGSEKRITFLPTSIAVLLCGAAYTPYDLEVGRAVFKHKLNLARPNYFICSEKFWKTYGDILRALSFIKTIICFDEIDDITLSIKKLALRHVEVETFEPTGVQGQTDVALVEYSSGTSGLQKAVELTHLHCIVCSMVRNTDPRTVFLVGEWYHNYDIFSSCVYFCSGGKVVYTDSFAPDVVLKSIQDCKVHIAVIIPSLVSYLARAEVDKYDLSSLSIIVSASCALHSKVIDKVKNRLPNLKNVIQIYGTTETGTLTSEGWATKGVKIGSVGVVAPGVTLKIVDPITREILGPNQRGEICARSLIFMKGYIGIEESMYLDEQGFFLTGDLGYYDEDRYFYVVGRIKDMICYDGNEVSPSELEALLEMHPNVQEAGVVGREGGELGHEPVAFVVRRTDAALTEHELLDYVSKEVSPWMQLRGGVKFVSKLPKNLRGKILHRRLREMLHEVD